MATGIMSSTQGVGALIMYVFALVGVIMAGMGIHGFYAHHNGNGRMSIGKAATMTIVGIVLAGGLLYVINSGSMTFGNSAGTSTLQNVVAP
jgi:peptidoglycan biosynthesis protein MviN/MurJ (putative lipid II flippase)